jgi:diguanylate cyclase (GGDEF)-like protein
MWLDGLIGGLSLGALAAAVVLTPVLASSADATATELVINVGYVVADLLLLGFVGLAAGLLAWRPGRAWSLIGLSYIATALVDGIYSYAEATGAFYPGSAFATLWPAALALLAGAAWQPQRSPAGDAGAAGAVIPAVFAAIALAVLAGAHWYDVGDAGVVLAVAALLAVALRGALAHRENLRLLRRSRTEALTDALTGLRNRRRLMDDLEGAIADARGGRASTLIFFDLDGFKLYNDSFGHNAGDALLQRLGGALQEATDGAAYRLGGDEFCVLLPGTHEADSPAVRAGAAALAEQGEGFAIGASLGVVALPGDADTPSLALQRADERMYAEKGGRRGSARSQTRDILLQVLGEREPALRHHMDQVAAMAATTARAMGLEGECVDEICRAAELHDIGKVAIPDSVLHKPAPLDDDEWALMRQHTLIGERILLAAPALRPVAALVRSSHERWDGGGYPDALRGEEIPLGSRIVGVCDAYDAMTSDRSYRAAIAPHEAFAELRRHAGRQFDGAVVDAFIAAVTSAAAAPATTAR